MHLISKMRDLLEAIVALPTTMFYNTGIATYIWTLSNKKEAEQRGKVQLINGVHLYQKMRMFLVFPKTANFSEPMHEIQLLQKHKLSLVPLDLLAEELKLSVDFFSQ